MSVHLSTAVCGPYSVQEARNCPICECGVLLSLPRLRVQCMSVLHQGLHSWPELPCHHSVPLARPQTQSARVLTLKYCLWRSPRISDRQIILSEEGKAPRPTTSADNTESKGGVCLANFLCYRRIDVVSRIAMEKQLQKYERALSQAGKKWAQKFWKYNALICAVLEAHSSYMQKRIKESFPQIYYI